MTTVDQQLQALIAEGHEFLDDAPFLEVIDDPHLPVALIERARELQRRSEILWQRVTELVDGDRSDASIDEAEERFAMFAAYVEVHGQELLADVVRHRARRPRRANG